MNAELRRQAWALGIECSFVDVDGVERQADEPTLRLLIKMLRSGKKDAEEALVVRHGNASGLAAVARNQPHPSLTLRKRDHVLASGDDPQSLLPDDLPYGSYRVDIGVANRVPKGIDLLHTPSRAYQPPFALQGRKSWVVSVQLYSLCNERNFGHGDFTDLLQLVELVAGAGGGGVGVNPLHALNEARPADASPYAPSSRRFLNWLYIDVAALPHVSASEIEALRPGDKPGDGLIDYQAVAAAKERALRLAWHRFVERGTEAERAAFAAFRGEMGEVLRRYAAFCCLRRREGGSWRHWPTPWTHPTSQDIARLASDNAEEVGFHEFVQFHAHRQLARCRQLADDRHLEIGLYLDIAVGVDPDGFDAWNEPDAFFDGLTIGAPPDALNRSGQNWGLTSFNPRSLRRLAYAPFRAMLAANMRYAGVVRLDHVMGLSRIYVIPPDAAPTKGVYVRLPLQDLLAVASLESQFHRCLIVGEDLGTVPDGLRDQLRAHGIWTYRVVMFERGATGFLPPESYPEAALATFSTHDLPTFAGWVSGDDLKLAQTLGLKNPESRESRIAAVSDLTRLATGGHAAAPLEFSDLARFLCRTPSRLISFAYEDLIGSSTQINVPGTHLEYPNWRHRVEYDSHSAALALERLVRTIESC